MISIIAGLIAAILVLIFGIIIIRREVKKLKHANDQLEVTYNLLMKAIRRNRGTN
jgi:uncharacterized protein YoxC